MVTNQEPCDLRNSEGRGRDQCKFKASLGYTAISKEKKRAGEIVQWVKILATKSDDPRPS